MRPVLSLLLLALALPAAAADRLYRWTDDAGVVHYSELAPGDRAFEVREIRPDPPPPPPPPAPPAPDSREGRCAQARANLPVLEGDGGVSMDLDGDGTPEPLTPDARAKEIEKTRKLLEHCPD